jgi:hypothetical protein
MTFFKQPIIIDDNRGFFNNYLFLRHPNFPCNKYIIFLTIIGLGVGEDTHSVTIFFELFNIVHENDFINNFFLIILIQSSFFFPTITISLSIILK